MGVASGCVSAKTLRGPRMRLLFPDTYVDADVPDSPRLWPLAALACRPDGVICGTSAAALWVAEPRFPYWTAAGRAGVAEIVERPGPVELVVPGRGSRSVAGMRVGRERLDACDIVDLPGDPGPLRLTSPARTVFDVARVLPTVEAVVVADAIASRQDLSADDVRAVADRYPGVRGRSGVPAVLALMNRMSTSVRLSRVRLAILAAGLDPPEVGPTICDGAGMTMAGLDLAWPAVRCGLQVP